MDILELNLLEMQVLLFCKNRYENNFLSTHSPAHKRIRA